MDLNRRLRCLSLNPTLRFETMSFSSSSSQVMKGTTNSTSVSSSVLAVDKSTPVFDLMLAAEEDKDEEDDEVK